MSIKKVSMEKDYQDLLEDLKRNYTESYLLASTTPDTITKLDALGMCHSIVQAINTNFGHLIKEKNDFSKLVKICVNRYRTFMITPADSRTFTYEKFFYLLDNINEIYNKLIIKIEEVR